MRLPVILLVLIALTHYGYEPLSAGFHDRHQAAAAIFYALRGLEGAALFVLLGLLARKPLVGFVCAVGVIEEGQTTVCRLAAGIAERPGYAPFEGLCGRGWYAIGLVVVGWLAFVILDNMRKP